MKLIIDTTDNLHIRLSLIDVDGRTVAKSKVTAFRRQGEKLLPALEKLLAKHSLTLAAIREIEAVNGAGSFSGLRIGVATANALAFALGIPTHDQSGQSLSKEGVSVIEPNYTAEANIGQRPAGSKEPVDKH